MNTVRTAILLAALTALFLAVGFVVGGEAGIMIAFVFALGMNLFAYWKGFRKNRHLDTDWLRSIFGEVFRFNLHPTILFGRHLFLKFDKEFDLAEVKSRFKQKHQSRNFET